MSLFPKKVEYPFNFHFWVNYPFNEDNDSFLEYQRSTAHFST